MNNNSPSCVSPPLPPHNPLPPATERHTRGIPKADTSTVKRLPIYTHTAARHSVPTCSASFPSLTSQKLQPRRPADRPRPRPPCVLSPWDPPPERRRQRLRFLNPTHSSDTKTHLAPHLAPHARTNARRVQCTNCGAVLCW